MNGVRLNSKIKLNVNKSRANDKTYRCFFR